MNPSTRTCESKSLVSRNLSKQGKEAKSTKIESNTLTNRSIITIGFQHWHSQTTNAITGNSNTAISEGQNLSMPSETRSDVQEEQISTRKTCSFKAFSISGNMPSLTTVGTVERCGKAEYWALFFSHLRNWSGSNEYWWATVVRGWEMPADLAARYSATIRSFSAFVHLLRMPFRVYFVIEKTGHNRKMFATQLHSENLPSYFPIDPFSIFFFQKTGTRLITQGILFPRHYGKRSEPSSLTIDAKEQVL